MAARYTDEQIIQALTATNGLVYAAAKRLGCSAVTIYARIDKSAKVKEAIDQQRGVMIDMAEAALMKAVGEGEGWAVCFLLKTIGKSRGYVERQEVTGKDGGAITFKFEWADTHDNSGHAADND